MRIHASSRTHVISGNQLGKFNGLCWNATIRNWARDELKIGALTERLLVCEIKLSNLMRLQQRYDCLNTYTISPGDFIREPLSAARTGHYGEAHAVEFTEPMKIWLNHFEDCIKRKSEVCKIYSRYSNAG